MQHVLDYLSWQWSRFIAFLKSKNISTHTVGGAIVTFAFAYDTSLDLRNYIGSLLVGEPVIVTRLGVVCANIVAGVTLWAKYSHSSSPAGTLARARAITSNGNAPTAAQVDAADVKIQ